MKLLLIFDSSLILENLAKYLDTVNISYFKVSCKINDIMNTINNNDITNVICDSKKSYGKNVYSTAFIEDKLDINIKNNLYFPLLLASKCNQLDVHLTYIGDGCIFKYDKNGGLTDLNISSHAIVNNYCEKILTRVCKILYLRIRYPIMGNHDPRCYLTKLSTFNKILDTNNSISIMPSLFHIMIELVKNERTGIFNMFDNTPVNSMELLLNYKHKVDSNIIINEMSEKKHNLIIGERSNIIMENDNLKKFCRDTNLTVNDTNESINDILSNMKNTCREIKHCLCCLNGNKVLLNLGNQPLANDFHSSNTISKIYPLRLMYCRECFHCQLSHSVNPSILFKNYKYVSGTSQTGLKFFEDNAEFIHKYKKKPGKILDIACNDGSQLDFFKELGWETYGIDPAENICPIAREKGHTVICDFWNDKCAKELPIMDVITAQNVFAHTPYIDKFLQSCKKVMDDNTSLFIQTSQRDMIINGEFDTTYHEHISFYNTKSMNILIKRNGLVLNRVLEHSIHGRSYIFEIKLTKDENIYNVDEHLKIENNLGLYNEKTYDRFKLNAERCINNLKLTIEKHRNNGYKCIGFGAAAKGQTLICYGNIDLEYIIDENPLKIGNYSPKLDIPIVSLEHFKEDKDEKILVVILAWNFAKEIKEKTNKNKGNKNIVIIEKYFPEIIIN